MKLFKWNERDYKWLIFILILIIGIILTWRLNDNDSVVNIISMIASGASIALAVIAIMQSIAYNESANSTYNAITEKLINLEHNTDDIKQKIMADVNTVIENSTISEDEKVDLKDNINSVVSSMEEYKKMSYKKLLSQELGRKIKNIYDFDEIMLKNSLYGDILICINNRLGKLKEIELIYIDSENIKKLKMQKYIKKRCDKMNANQYMILIGRNIPADLYNYIQGVENLFKLNIFDISDMNSDELKSAIKLKLD